MKTAEFVTPKHPDKVCDRISDSVLDWALARDHKARVAIEAMGGHGKVVVMGEMTIENASEYEIPEEIKGIVKNIAGDVEVFVNVAEQSREIGQGVDIGGAGDQGIMIGYACMENEEMIPQEAYLARSLCRFLYDRHPYDGKTQITLSEKGEIDTIVASFQNTKKEDLIGDIKEWSVSRNKSIGRIHANPAGDWNSGGFQADTGLTGRKIMVDNYGPRIPVGGGAFSGKDPSKVDRSGAYMARRMAVDILRGEDDTKEVIVKLAYAIGVADPVMVWVEIEDFNGKKYCHVLDKNQTPNKIIEKLNLSNPIYSKTAEWGHFGNGFNWDN